MMWHTSLCSMGQFLFLGGKAFARRLYAGQCNAQPPGDLKCQCQQRDVARLYAVHPGMRPPASDDNLVHLSMQEGRLAP